MTGGAKCGRILGRQELCKIRSRIYRQQCRRRGRTASTHAKKAKPFLGLVGLRHRHDVVNEFLENLEEHCDFRVEGGLLISSSNTPDDFCLSVTPLSSAPARQLRCQPSCQMLPQTSAHFLRDSSRRTARPASRHSSRHQVSSCLSLPR